MSQGEIVMENPYEEKGHSRRVIVAMAVVCMALLAGLVGTLAFYISTINELNFQVAKKDETISSLNSQLTEKDYAISSLNSQISALQNTLASKDSQINWLNSTILSLYNCLYLNVSALLVNTSIDQDANSSTIIWNDVLPFAGYITVYVQSSSNTTYVKLSYTYHEVYYQNCITVGTNGAAAFPVLPALVEISVGNTDTISTVTTLIMAIYYY